MRPLFNLVTLANVLSLGSAFLIPVSSIWLGKEYFLVALNLYYLGHALAIPMDALNIARLETFFPHTSAKRGLSIVGRLFNASVVVFALLLIVGVAEWFIWGFSIAIVAFARHLFNVSRMCLPQLAKFSKLSVVMNLLAGARNFTILGLIVLVDTTNTLAFGLVVISALEALSVLLVIALVGKLSIRTEDGTLLKIFVGLSRQRRMLTRAPVVYGISNAIVGSIDRVLVIGLLGIDDQISFLKYRVLAQYIDAFFSVFSYQIHLNIIKDRMFMKAKEMAQLLFTTIVFGCSASLFIFKIAMLQSLIIIGLLVVLLSTRRVIESILGSYFVSIRQYSTCTIKNLMELCAVALVFVGFSGVFAGDMDKFFFAYVVGLSLPFLYYVFKLRAANS